MPSYIQDEVQSLSLRDPETFWSFQANQLHWHKKPSRALQRTTRKLANAIEHPNFTWFPDGEISTSYNCVDRHVQNGNGDATAIIWDSPVTGSKEKVTYKQLLAEVEVLAGVLREEGVKKGDVVLVYSIAALELEVQKGSSRYIVPMIPAALFAILAISRLGAIHTVVFGGFAPASLAQRIEASQPRAVMTASCGIEGAKGPMAYKPFIEGALEKSKFEPEKIIIWEREQTRWSPMDETKGERHWQQLVDSARKRGVNAEAVPVKSDDGLYIIYTSGECALSSHASIASDVRMRLKLLPRLCARNHPPFLYMLCIPSDVLIKCFYHPKPYHHQALSSSSRQESFRDHHNSRTSMFYGWPLRH